MQQLGTSYSSHQDIWYPIRNKYNEQQQLKLKDFSISSENLKFYEFPPDL
jgi:hypothetical protein